jgi:hypothetical protein
VRLTYLISSPPAAAAAAGTTHKTPLQTLRPAANKAVKQPMGSRSAAVGFVSEVANTLLQAADASNQELHCAALAAVLESSDDWQGSIQQQGSIHSLLQVRCGTGQDSSIGC